MRLFRYLLSAVLLLVFLSPAQAVPTAGRFQVLVVFSYEKDFPLNAEVLEGISAVLGRQAELHPVYLNTRGDLAAAPQQAAAAYAFYQRLQPDGVIAVDDNAQSLFVVPYLRDKVATPVMFCGVNAVPELYGYPASNVSGILERQPVGETIALAQQLVPEIRRLGFMMQDCPTGRAIVAEIKAGNGSYPAEFVAFDLPASAVEALAMASAQKERTDAMYIVNFSGIADAQGRPLTDAEFVPRLAQAYGKPLISGSSYNVRYPGVLAAVAKTGQEQGRTAARMLLRALQGEPLAKLPITRNYRGLRMINVTTLRQLQLQPSAVVLRGAELVRSEQAN